MSNQIEETEGETPAVEHHDLCTTIAGIAGNMMEWYDFSVFGYFSDIIGLVFFPEQKGHAALIESFAVFGGAFLVRPIGGLVIGLLGDNHGRKSAVETSIFLMAFPTFALGCLPSFETAGWISTFLLVIMRLLQGFSVGGQLMSSVVFALERSDRSRWGFWASSVFAVAGMGTAVGSFLSYILRETLNDDQLQSWGWRVPFLFGGIGVLPGAYLKYRGQDDNETPPVRHGEIRRGPKKSTTVEEAFSPSNRRALIAAALVPCFSAATYYIVFVWLAIYMEAIVDPPVPHAFMISTSIGILGIFMSFLGGWISDFYPKYVQLMFFSSAIIAVISPIFLIFIGNGNPWIAFLCQTTIGLLLSIWSGAMLPWLIASFPPRVRLTSVSIGYNLAVGICGGFSPAVATLLVDNFASYSPGFIMTALAVVSWTGLCIAPKNMEEVSGTERPSFKNVGVEMT